MVELADVSADFADMWDESTPKRGVKQMVGQRQPEPVAEPAKEEASTQEIAYLKEQNKHL